MASFYCVTDSSTTINLTAKDFKVLFDNIEEERLAYVALGRTVPPELLRRREEMRCWLHLVPRLEAVSDQPY